MLWKVCSKWDICVSLKEKVEELWLFISQIIGMLFLLVFIRPSQMLSKVSGIPRSEISLKVLSIRCHWNKYKAKAFRKFDTKFCEVQMRVSVYDGNRIFLKFLVIWSMPNSTSCFCFLTINNVFPILPLGKSSTEQVKIICKLLKGKITVGCTFPTMYFH